jgi:hypothetical protein
LPAIVTATVPIAAVSIFAASASIASLLPLLHCFQCERHQEVSHVLHVDVAAKLVAEQFHLAIPFLAAAATGLGTVVVRELFV